MMKRSLSSSKIHEHHKQQSVFHNEFRDEPSLGRTPSFIKYLKFELNLRERQTNTKDSIIDELQLRDRVYNFIYVPIELEKVCKN